MNITLEKESDLTSFIRLHFKKEDYAPQVDTAIKKLAKKVKMDGFRPGLVPLGLVKNMYGKSVILDEIEKIIRDSANTFIDEQKLDFIGSPLPVEGQEFPLDINNLTDFEYNIEIGHPPAVDLSYLDNAPMFPHYKIGVDNQLIDEELLRSRKRFATYIYPDSIEEKDVLTFLIEELNQDSSIKEGGISTTSSIMLDLLQPEAKANIEPLHKQDSTELNVFEMIDRDRESIAKNILNITEMAMLDQISNRFRLTLNNITRSVPSELNEEFFQKVYGPEGPKTEEEMREMIRKDYVAYFEGRSDSVLMDDLYIGIMAKVHFPLPDQLLKRLIKRTEEKEMSDEEVEQQYPAFAKQVRWDLIQKKIINENNYQVTDEEIIERAQTSAMSYLYQNGMQNIGQEWLQKLVERQLEDKKFVSRTAQEILSDKVLKFIKSKVTLQEKEVSLDEFNELVRKMNEQYEQQTV